VSPRPQRPSSTTKNLPGLNDLAGLRPNKALCPQACRLPTAYCFVPIAT
jgi:hypothetical protein